MKIWVGSDYPTVSDYFCNINCQHPEKQPIPKQMPRLDRFWMDKQGFDFSEQFRQNRKAFCFEFVNVRKGDPMKILSHISSQETVNQISNYK